MPELPQSGPLLPAAGASRAWRFPAVREPARDAAEPVVPLPDADFTVLRGHYWRDVV